MTWSDFYLICFLVGLALSVASLLSGFHFHLPIRFHIPHGAHLPHVSATQAAQSMSPFNVATLMAFLAWFGAMGYILSRYSASLGIGILLASIAAGLVGGSIIHFFLLKVVLRFEHPLEASDSDLSGAYGRITMPIRAGGTGEIVFSHGGTRQSAGARSEDGSAIAKGTDVVVMRWDRGIAYVRRWDEVSGELQDEPRVNS